MTTKWKWDYQHIIILAAFAVGLAWKVATLIAGQPLTVANEMPAIILAVTAILAFFKSPPSNPADALEQGEGGGGITQVGRPRPDVLVVPVVPLAPASATDVTKPDALTSGKVAGKIGPAVVLALVVGLSLFVPKQSREVPCQTTDTVQTSDVASLASHCFIAAEGCAWWTANSKPVVTDIGSIASCVISQLFLGVSVPATIVGSCIGATIADVEEIVASVISFYEQNDAGAPVSDAGLATATWHSTRFDADIALHLPPTVDKPTLARLRAVRAN